MKAVILEIKNDFAAVLSDDGCIVTVKNNNYEIGQVIQMNKSKLQFTKKIVVFAATAAACVFLSVGAWAYASPYTYVSVDVNPSIEYTVNRFDRVLRVKAVNDDGEEILQEISLSNLRNKTIEEALATTVAQLSEAGYFEGSLEGGIVITTASKDEEKADELAQELQQAVETEVAESSDLVVVEALSVTLERVEEAKELGVTPGKLNLVEKLQASATDPTTINVADWLNKSVKDIMKATKDNRNAAAVSGSALSVETSDQAKEQKQQEKEDQKLQAKENQKLQNSEDKALQKAEKNEEKLKAEAEKATEKAIAAEEKSKEATLKEKEAEKKLKDAKNKADQKELAAAENATKEAKKEADQAKEDKKSADKAAEEAKKAAKDAKKATEEATQDVTNEKGKDKKKDNPSKNTTNPSNEDEDKTIGPSEKSSEQPSMQEDSPKDDVSQQEGESANNDEAQDNSSNTDSDNSSHKDGNSNSDGKN